MMTHEPKCVLWKRLGAKKVAEQLANFTEAEELEFWQKETEKLKANQSKAQTDARLSQKATA